MKPKSSLNFTENFIIVRRIRDDSEAREERRDWITNNLDAFLYLELGCYFNCIKLRFCFVFVTQIIYLRPMPNGLTSQWGTKRQGSLGCTAALLHCCTGCSAWACSGHFRPKKVLAVGGEACCISKKVFSNSSLTQKQDAKRTGRPGSRFVRMEFQLDLEIW